MDVVLGLRRALYLLLLAVVELVGSAAGLQREVRWYTSAGSRGQIDAEKAHCTGFFSCCTGFAIFPNASFKCPDAKFWQVTTAPYIGNYTVDHTISICKGCDRPDGDERKPFNWTAAQASIPAMVDCADAGNITGFLIDWEPPSHADHWPAEMLNGAAIEYARFANKLATALHVRGRRLGLDLSGDSDRPIGVFTAFGDHAKAVDYFTLMSTYSYYDIARPGNQDYSDYLMVENAMRGGIPAAKLGCGIKSVSQKSNASHWNATSFGKFVQWIGAQGVRAVDIWRNDIDVTWPIDPTAPWMVDLLDSFLAGRID